MVADLLRRHSSAPTADVAAFRDALLFEWLIAGTDAHAKNYAVLHGTGGRVRLGPLDDVTSTLPYGQLDRRRLKLAMKMGGTYRLAEVGRRDIEKLAISLELDGEATLRRARDLAAAIPDSTRRVREAMTVLGTPVVPRLQRQLEERARECAATLST